MPLFARESHPLEDDEVFELMQPLMEAQTWPALRDVINRNPVLTSPRGPRFFAFLAARSEQKPDEHVMARRLRQIEHLLTRCGEIGVAAAIDEEQSGRRGPWPIPDEAMLRQVTELLFQPTWPATQRMLDEQPALYGVAAIETLKDMLAMQLDDDDQRMAEQIALHLAILARCRQVGVDAAFDELRRAAK
jgi:hypothetical protein